MEDKSFYSLEKIFNRVIEAYSLYHSVKNCRRSTSKATLRSGTPSPNGAACSWSRTASSLSLTFVLII